MRNSYYEDIKDTEKDIIRTKRPIKVKVRKMKKFDDIQKKCSNRFIARAKVFEAVESGMFREPNFIYSKKNPKEEEFLP